MAEGHPQARLYPLGMLWEEMQIVVERKNSDAASEAALLHVVGTAVMSKKGLDNLKKVVKELTNGS